MKCIYPELLPETIDQQLSSDRVKPEKEFFAKYTLKCGYAGRNKNTGQYLLEIQEYQEKILFNKFSGPPYVRQSVSEIQGLVIFLPGGNATMKQYRPMLPVVRQAQNRMRE